MWYNTIKYYYEQGYYTNDDVRVFVESGYITPEEYEQITGEPYTP